MPFDVTAAYLHGVQKENEYTLVLPPSEFRSVDERGVVIYWLFVAPLYGGRNAGATWYRTFGGARDLQGSSPSLLSCLY